MLRQLVYDDVKNRFKIGGEATAGSVVGGIDIPLDAMSITVAFSSPMPNTNYIVIPVWVNTTDTYPTFQPLVVTAMTVNGFTVSWNTAVDTDKYRLFYQCLSLG